MEKDFIARFYLFYLYEPSWTICMCCVSCGFSEFSSTRKWILNLSFVKRFTDDDEKRAAHCSQRRLNGEFTLNSQRSLIENNFLLFVAGANLFSCKSRFPVRLLVESHEIILQILLAHFFILFLTWTGATVCHVCVELFPHLLRAWSFKKDSKTERVTFEASLIFWCCKAFTKFYNIWHEIHVKRSDFSCNLNSTLRSCSRVELLVLFDRTWDLSACFMCGMLVNVDDNVTVWCSAKLYMKCARIFLLG